MRGIRRTEREEFTPPIESLVIGVGSSFDVGLQSVVNSIAKSQAGPRWSAGDGCSFLGLKIKIGGAPLVSLEVFYSFPLQAGAEVTCHVTGNRLFYSRR